MKDSIKTINHKIKELKSMKKYPSELFYIGNTNLLQKPKISIVGSRHPNSYGKNFTSELSRELSSAGVCIVSGVAMGIDAIAHTNAGYDNTIAVVANGLDIKYPKVNKNIISSIEKQGLVLSQFREGSVAKKFSFVQRNEIVVALGDVLIITYADFNSGSLRSAEFALKMGKQIYVPPHRINESNGTNELLNKQLAKPIYNIKQFIEELGYKTIREEKDEFIEFCLINPTYDEAIFKYPTKVFEYELKGKIKIENGTIQVI